MATETVADLANEYISQRDQARKHPLEMASKARAADDSGAPEAQAGANWEHPPVDQRSASTEKIAVYLDDFISVVHGVPRERRQFLCHLFHQIDRVFRPNEELDTNHKYPIPLNNLGQ